MTAQPSPANGPRRNRPGRWAFPILALLLTLLVLPIGSQAQEMLPDAKPDLGDAPDSTYNHHGVANTAYPGPVRGRFPTVWEGTPLGEPAGPIHFTSGLVWLGEHVTVEREADIGADEDGVNNILNEGADRANDDRGDDGWLNPEVPMPHCERTTLKVRLSHVPDPTHAARLYLNVWFDGNRDGDWADTGPCPHESAADGRAYEWIVQNHVLVPGLSNAREFVVLTDRVLNAHPRDKAWVRFTLSESPAPRPAWNALPDGRGPHPPHGYLLGETEDYLWHPEPGGEPGRIEIAKSALVTSSDPLHVGDVFTYSIELSHVGGSATATTAMTDTLPAAVRLVRGPVVKELVPHAAPLVAYFDPSSGPSGTVGWRGRLTPGARIRVDFLVAVRYCPPYDPPVIRNVARALQTDGSEIADEALVRVDCHPPEPPHLRLSKRAFTLHPASVVDPPDPAAEPPDPAAELAVADWVPGMRATYLLVLENGDPVVHTVHISDDMPSGVVAVAATASDGVARIIDGGRTVVWNGRIGPDNTPVTIRIHVKLRLPVHCEQPLTNVAYWSTRFHRGKSNPASLFVRCRDLGDAPDSTNHFGLRMSAYPGPVTTPANFPTVFGGNAPPDPRGPLHLHARPFHLGRHVSFEFEADVGPDADGRNNIEPRLDQPNLDRWDDGLDLSRVQFSHCQPTRFPVLLSINPDVSAVNDVERTGYLNVWVDSNRDGDWDDSFRGCPQGTGPALEHIVIDWPVDLAAGVGLHTVWVRTSGPVYWPDELAERPSWLRVTLSERKSNKTLPPGTNTYGDGRGYDVPFKLGETEDYLYRAPRLADPTVSKRGRLHRYPYPHYEAVDPGFSEDDGVSEDAPDDGVVANDDLQGNLTYTRWRWIANWVVAYRNAGPVPAYDVHVIDEYSDNQTLLAQRSYPHLDPISLNPLVYPVGTLAPGGRGYIILRTGVPLSTPPGTVLTNSVRIASFNDGDLTNNTAVVRLTIPLRPPVIVYPRPGTTCGSTLTIRGRAQAGVLVDLTIDGSLAASVPSGDGRWSHTVTLPDGKHVLWAVARTPDGVTSAPSPKVIFIVDSTLSWDPLSLHFVGPRGRVLWPKDEHGRMDETGWRVRLRASTTYTASVGLCCSDPNAEVTLDVPGGETVKLTDEDGDRVFEAQFTAPDVLPAIGRLRLCVTCDLITRCSDGTLLIDPYGTVFDLLEGYALPGATVACYEIQPGEDGDLAYSLWDAGAFGQANPQTTGDDGYFSFFTPPGTYQLHVTKAGYQPHWSDDIVVADEPVQVDVPLTPELDVTPDVFVTVGPEGFEPAVLRITPGTVVGWLNVDVEPHTATSLAPVGGPGTPHAPEPGGSEAWDSGLLFAGDVYQRQLDTLGAALYYDGENPANNGLVIVEQAAVYLPFVVLSGGE